MSTGLVVVLAVAALAPLVAVRLRLPGALLEIVAGIVLGPAVLGLVRPDATLSAVALLGLSFLLFLAGSEVDLRRFRGTPRQAGRRLAGDLPGAPRRVVARAGRARVGGAVVIGVALLATSLGLVVPVLADAGALGRPIGRIAVAGASAGEVAAVVLLSVGAGRERHPARGPDPAARAPARGPGRDRLAVAGVEHSMPLTALVARLADTSAQIRVRWTVLLVAGLALAAQALGFEAILGAFLAGMLVRALDPDPEQHPPALPGQARRRRLRPARAGLLRDQRAHARPARACRAPGRAGHRARVPARAAARARAARAGVPPGARPGGSSRRWRCCRRPRCRSSSPRPPSAGRWVCSTRPSPPGSSRPGSCRCSCSRPSRWPSCPGSR